MDIASVILDESKWLFGSMLLALLVVGVHVAARWRARPSRPATLRVMNLYYGCMLGTMASGHLLAVGVKAGQGRLEGPLWLLVALGLVLAVPSWWLAIDRRASQPAEGGVARRAVALNAFLVLCLVVSGLHNLPLAAPAVLNIAYACHSRRALGWAIVAVTIALYLALFAGSAAFLASGQTFEQFRGLE